jgi:DNA-binding transcriptional MerR regulator
MSTVKLSDDISITAFPENDEEVLAFTKPKNKKGDKWKGKYRSKDIQKIANISPMQIKHWTNSEVIIPLQRVRGTGRSHIYNDQNLVESLICAELSKYSINLNMMKDILNVLRTKKWNFRISLNVGERLITDSFKKSTEWSGKAPGKTGKEILKILFNKETADNKLKAIANLIKREKGSKRKELVQWFNEREDVGKELETAMEKYKATEHYIRITKKLTIWDFLEIYPQRDHIALAVWAEAEGISGIEPLPSDLCMHLLTINLDEVVSKCKSIIVLPLFNLFMSNAEESGENA